MFLKHLSIMGFKSFADRTDIMFSGGITAFVGANGCGKSNVLDAIKWAMGEQDNESPRAGKATDVIFGGTKARKASKMAEVTLTFGNAGVLPLGEQEVKIKCRLYRSGKSEYFVNARKVKHKYIQELLWDTGLGRRGYFVIEQGAIDTAIFHEPDRLRHLFEEAAGITHFKMRRAEAEQNLASASDTINMLEHIMSEVQCDHKRLKARLKSVNHTTQEEFVKITEQYEFMSGQIAKLEKAHEDLSELADEIHKESSLESEEKFIKTYDLIKENFHNMFQRLFGGGMAELRLSDSGNLLESDIEIFVQLSDKKLNPISMLSGGERSMTMVALLFAAYMVKPSPFCLLDCIDAEMDAVHIDHLTGLLREFSAKSQFIIITHYNATLAVADTIFDVTMEESGVTMVNHRQTLAH